MARACAFTIGQRVGKNNQQVVIAIEKGIKHSVVVFHCEECAKDPELFKDAIFRIDSSNLKAGKTSCGCTLNPRWKDWQWDIKIKRQCKKMDLTFLGFRGEWNGDKSRVVLRCNKDNHEWDMSVNNLVRDRGCPKCKARQTGESKTKADHLYVEEFLATGVFAEGTKFTRTKPRARTWFVECPKCPDEVFVSDRANLQLGKRPCNCSGGGFDSEIDGYVYVLKIQGEKQFVKFGITNFPKRRFRDHTLTLKNYGLSIEEEWFMKVRGDKAKEIEDGVKCRYATPNLDVDGFKTETTDYDNFEAVKDFVVNYIY